MSGYTLVADEPWFTLPIDQSASPDAVPFLRLGLADDEGDPVIIVDLIAFSAAGEASETLPALITVEDKARGPHTPEEVELGDGTAAYRSIGAIPGTWENDTATPQFLCCHALRQGEVDVVAHTWLGSDPRILKEVIGPLETMLASLRIDS